MGFVDMTCARAAGQLFPIDIPESEVNEAPSQAMLAQGYDGIHDDASSDGGDGTVGISNEEMSSIQSSVLTEDYTGTGGSENIVHVESGHSVFNFPGNTQL